MHAYELFSVCSGVKVTAVVPNRPTMRKVVESEPEPQFTEAPDSVRNLDLLVSVNCDFCQLEFEDDLVHFKDTLMLQTRVYEATMTNCGSIALDFCWQLIMETPSNAPATRSVTFAPAQSQSLTERPMTAGTEQVCVSL